MHLDSLRYNTGPNHYLSEVWLKQAKRRRNGAYVSYPVCEPGEWNGDFFQIEPLPSEVIVAKHPTAHSRVPTFDLVLRSRGVRTVIMTGVATNVCVGTTARQAFLKDYYVVFTSDCSATFSRAAHDATLYNIDQFFGEVATGEQIVACWPGAEARMRVAS